MAATIYKYHLKGPITHLLLPNGWKCRLAAEQHGEPHIWVEVDHLAPLVDTVIHRVPTGGKVPDGTSHIGSIVLFGGDVVWHYYAALSLPPPVSPSLPANVTLFPDIHRRPLNPSYPASHVS